MALLGAASLTLIVSQLPSDNHVTSGRMLATVAPESASGEGGSGIEEQGSGPAPTYVSDAGKRARIFVACTHVVVSCICAPATLWFGNVLPRATIFVQAMVAIEVSFSIARALSWVTRS